LKKIGPVDKFCQGILTKVRGFIIKKIDSGKKITRKEDKNARAK